MIIWMALEAHLQLPFGGPAESWLCSSELKCGPPDFVGAPGLPVSRPWPPECILPSIVAQPRDPLKNLFLREKRYFLLCLRLTYKYET